jgi:serine/threonine protein kinase
LESTGESGDEGGTPIPAGTLVDASERGLGDGPGSLTSSRAGSDPATTSTKLIDTVHLEPGAIVPSTRYRIVRWLGTGRMGMVYEAAHVDIERRVALKILRTDEGLTLDAAATFRREARTASQIGAPNIVEIVDFAQLPDGRLMFAMELLDGESLNKLVKTAPVPAERLIPILRQICKGLAAAHRKEVVHRDIKPDNVMVVRKDGREDVVKIVDFGISSLLASGRAIETAPAGTPFYMAPEQIDGHSYDGRVDLYGLGCTAYALMTGRPPFVAATLEEVFEWHRTTTPKPPSERVPTAKYPAALEAVVLRLLAKSPDDRYPDADQAEAALCEAQIEAGLHTAWDDLPLPDLSDAERESLARRMPRPQTAPSKRGFWPAVAGVSLVAALGLGAARLASPGEAAVAQTNRVDQLDREAKDAAARAFFVYPAADDPSGPTAYKKVRELEQLEDATTQGMDRANALREEFAATLVRLGDFYWDRDGGRPFATDYYAQALVFDPRHPRARERSQFTFGQIGELERRANESDFTDAELQGTRLLQALANLDEEGRRAALQELLADENTTDALPIVAGNSLERLAGDLGVPRKPRPKPAPTVDATMEVSPEADVPVEPTEEASPAPSAPIRDPAGAKALTRDGIAARKAGRRADAERLFHRALELDAKHAPAHYELAELAFDAADYANATKSGERAVSLAPRNAGYRVFLGDLYARAIEYAKARAQYERALELGHGQAQARLERLREKTGH